MNIEAIIAQDLIGTCKSLDDILAEHGTDHDNLTIEQLKRLDNITMECDCCGWWVDTDEIDEDGQYVNCRDEQTHE